MKRSNPLGPKQCSSSVTGSGAMQVQPALLSSWDAVAAPAGGAGLPRAAVTSRPEHAQDDWDATHGSLPRDDRGLTHGSLLAVTCTWTDTATSLLPARVLSVSWA